MSLVILFLLAALALWGVVATLVRLDFDGYGRPEIRDRNRHVEHLGEL
ncbi:hypothetical protein MUN74_02460 [Agromyces endophyticus]|nr:hypothetical protein [Agromyces sp. H17E-10]UOQ89803.1 hypothetical protein MUN74_02460 [Agromyces sp. H17E-10]